MKRAVAVPINPKRQKAFARALKGQEQINFKIVDLDLKPGVYNGKKVKETRKMLGASQTVFAQFLGVSVRSVRAWEAGRKGPLDSVARFMDEIRHNPEIFRQRLRESISVRKKPGGRNAGKPY
jgi:putative transcriptional regulator